MEMASDFDCQVDDGVGPFHGIMEFADGMNNPPAGAGMKMFAHPFPETVGENFPLPDPGGGCMNAEGANPTPGHGEDAPLLFFTEIPGDADIFFGFLHAPLPRPALPDMKIDIPEDDVGEGLIPGAINTGGKSTVRTIPVPLLSPDLPGGIPFQLPADLKKS